MFGCTTGAQIPLAHIMGYSPLFLAGQDMGYPRNTSRYNEWWFTGGEWKQQIGGHPDKSKCIDGAGGCLTDPVMDFYKTQCIKVWRMELPQMINATPGGTIIETPQIDTNAEEFVKRQGLGYDHLFFSDEEITGVCDRYLVARHTYPVPIGLPGDPKRCLLINVEAVPDEWEVSVREACRRLHDQLDAQKKDHEIDPDKMCDYLRGLRKEMGMA